MNNKLNEHNGDYIKRQAKKIKKQEGITYLQALEKASIKAGFKSWKHFKNISKNVSPLANLDGMEGNLQSELPNTKPLITPKGIYPYRNLLVAATNILLDKHHISLDGKSSDDEDGHAFVELFGYPSVILWQSIGYDELLISVWWKYSHDLHPQVNLSGNARENFKSSTPLADKNKYKKFVGVVTSGWFERRTGKYLMGIKNEEILKGYTRRGEKEELEKLPLQRPKGFESEGKFYR